MYSPPLMALLGVMGGYIALKGEIRKTADGDIDSARLHRVVENYRQRKEGGNVGEPPTYNRSLGNRPPPYGLLLNRY